MGISRRSCLALLALPASAARAQAAPAEVQAELPGARLLGGGRLRFFGLRVYDARLWAAAPLGDDDWAAQPLVLEIEYARSMVGRQIADRSLKEMRRQREIGAEEGERWLAAMQRLFPDVKEGDRISGVQQPGRSSRFFVNGRFTGELRDAEFTRLFFGVWLSPRSSEPALREALLGRAGGS